MKFAESCTTGEAQKDREEHSSSDSPQHSGESSSSVNHLAGGMESFTALKQRQKNLTTPEDDKFSVAKGSADLFLPPTIKKEAEDVDDLDYDEGLECPMDEHQMKVEEEAASDWKKAFLEESPFEGSKMMTGSPKPARLIKDRQSESHVCVA